MVFFAMTGLCFGNKCLVSRSYKDDGIFFLIYLIVVILVIVKEQIGKWFVIVWLTMWFAIQFICHEWYTIFNKGFMGTLERKIEYFSGTIQWLQIEGKYIPDVYHAILHILILCTLISTIVYSIKSQKKNSRPHHTRTRATPGAGNAPPCRAPGERAPPAGLSPVQIACRRF